MKKINKIFLKPDPHAASAWGQCWRFKGGAFGREETCLAVACLGLGPSLYVRVSSAFSESHLFLRACHVSLLDLTGHHSRSLSLSLSLSCTLSYLVLTFKLLTL